MVVILIIKSKCLVRVRNTDDPRLYRRGVICALRAAVLFLPLRGCVALRIAMDSIYADFAGAKMCPCPNSAVGIVCEPLIGSSPG